jgi:hypothetical protein
MQSLLKPRNRALVLTALLALAVILYPPWYSDVQNGQFAMGELTNVTQTISSLGYSWLWAPPAPNHPNCSMLEFACWVDIRWGWLWLELLGVAVLGGVLWLLDRPRGEARAA